MSVGPENISNATPMIETIGLKKSFGGVRAVKGVSVRIEPGICFGIIGPNGSGKSTFLDCISGIQKGYEGTALLSGVDISGLSIHKIARLGLVRTFQVSRLFEEMSVLSNVMVAVPDQPGESLWKATIGSWKRSQIDYVRNARSFLTRYGLAEHEGAYASELSGGQRRLLELARLMATHPRVVLLDEPFAGVSPINRSRLANQLQDLVKQGITVVMIEHRLELVEKLCDRVAVMAEGQIIAEGSMADLRRDKQVISAYLGELSSDAFRM